MKDYAILAVVYHETEEHYKMALKSWAAFPQDVEIVAVNNKNYQAALYPATLNWIENDENCLAKAWNIGLKKIFETYEFALVSGLDSLAPDSDAIEFLIDTLKYNPDYGIVSASPSPLHINDFIKDIKHGDGSFSFFVISKEAFENVGGFDERFKPAYFEDNDYLERLWKAGYKPKQSPISYYHVTQGTVKYGKDITKKYPEFMQRNLELFKSIYGKVPEHLPEDIKFI